MAHQADEGRAAQRSGWHWLLFVPVIVPLVTPFYNGTDPYFLGFPRFYWLQIAFIILGVGTTTLVYQMTKTRPAAVAGPASTAVPVQSSPAPGETVDRAAAADGDAGNAPAADGDAADGDAGDGTTASDGEAS